MKNIDALINLQIAQTINSLYEAASPQTAEDIGLLHQKISHAVHTAMETLYDPCITASHHLSNDQVVLEVIDPSNQRIYRRAVPLTYEESANGILLKGENLHSQPASIAFLSQSAVEAITDLTGKGLNNPRCDHHSPSSEKND